MSKKKKTTKRKKKNRGHHPSGLVSGQTESDDLAEIIREHPIIKHLLRSFRKLPLYKTDFDELQNELDEMTSAVKMTAKNYKVDSTLSLMHAGKARIRVQGYRDRVSAILVDLRRVNTISVEAYEIGESFIWQMDEVHEYQASAARAVIANALREIRHLKLHSESTLEAARTVLFNLDAKTRTIDDWATLHKQYVFLSGMAPGSQTGIDNGGQPSKRKRSGLGKSNRR